MRGLFAHCENLKEINLTNFDTRKITNMRAMFAGFKLTNINLSNFNTDNVIKIEAIFYKCNKINKCNFTF